MEQVLAAAPPADPQRWITRQAIARAWSEHQAETPLVLAPVSLQEPFAVGADLDDFASVLASMRLVTPVNLLGLPSVAVAGVQLIGPRFGEQLCLEAATAVEAGVMVSATSSGREHAIRREQLVVESGRWGGVAG
jgi:amidase